MDQALDINWDLDPAPDIDTEPDPALFIVRNLDLAFCTSSDPDPARGTDRNPDLALYENADLLFFVRNQIQFKTLTIYSK